MSTIKIYAELHFEVQRPVLTFKLNDMDLASHFQLISSADCLEQVGYTLTDVELDDFNTLGITLSGKTHKHVTERSDHWVDIKEIYIDNVRSDTMLINSTEFTHHMSDEWVEEMANSGHQIEKTYKPGTHLRLNGECKYFFSNPLWLARTRLYLQ